MAQTLEEVDKHEVEVEVEARNSEAANTPTVEELGPPKEALTAKALKQLVDPLIVNPPSEDNIIHDLNTTSGHFVLREEMKDR
ncbi:hypothetical protein C4D60_Mb05t14950 [Musa balbisiana]|uniref:Uncharacterized protein n=1 Tax=Musa balbisiana TaxID=52838 RepID=A0A4S8JW76_MUSBA|nr:hypothetical protein C4D60_Mb05t14950 [Musa balbisiana]